MNIAEFHPHTLTPSQELERGLEASGKTHSQEVKGLRTRNKALAIEAVSLRDTVEKLQSMLKVCIHKIHTQNKQTNKNFRRRLGRWR